MAEAIFIARFAVLVLVITDISARNYGGHTPWYATVLAVGVAYFAAGAHTHKLKEPKA